MPFFRAVVVFVCIFFLLIRSYGKYCIRIHDILRDFVIGFFIVIQEIDVIKWLLYEFPFFWIVLDITEKKRENEKRNEKNVTTSYKNGTLLNR